MGGCAGPGGAGPAASSPTTSTRTSRGCRFACTLSIMANGVSMTNDDLERIAADWLRLIDGDQATLSWPRTPRLVLYRLAQVMSPDDLVWWDSVMERDAGKPAKFSGRIVLMTAAEICEVVYKDSLAEPEPTDATILLTVRKRRDIAAFRVAGRDLSGYSARAEEPGIVHVEFRDKSEIDLPVSNRKRVRDVVDLLRTES